MMKAATNKQEKRKGVIIIKEKDIVDEIDFLNRSLNSAIAELSELKKKIPEGYRLSSIKHGNVYQYYQRKVGIKGNGVYINKKNIDKAMILAQIEYDEKLIVILKNNIETLTKLKTLWVDDPFDAAFNMMLDGKKLLVNSQYDSDELFIKKWKNQKYEGVSFKDDYPEFFTRRGLRVRSKSEVIISDILEENNIPFLYEKPLKLKAGTVHPDFTLLNIRQRREIYWEHFGMMDDMDYRNNAFNKIRNYESSGYYQHDSLIWTFETGKNPLNTKEIRKMILELKKSLGYD